MLRALHHNLTAQVTALIVAQVTGKNQSRQQQLHGSTPDHNSAGQMREQERKQGSISQTTTGCIAHLKSSPALNLTHKTTSRRLPAMPSFT